MRRDVLRRVRWGNVALACTVLIALVPLVDWPLVSSSAPDLPPDTPRPLVAGVSPATSGPRTGGRGKTPARRRARGGAAKTHGRDAAKRRAAARGGAKQRAHEDRARPGKRRGAKQRARADRTRPGKRGGAKT